MAPTRRLTGKTVAAKAAAKAKRNKNKKVSVEALAKKSNIVFRPKIDFMVNWGNNRPAVLQKFFDSCLTILGQQFNNRPSVLMRNSYWDAIRKDYNAEFTGKFFLVDKATNSLNVVKKASELCRPRNNSSSEVRVADILYGRFHSKLMGRYKD